MAKVTSYMQIKTSVTNCYSEYMENEYTSVRTYDDNITSMNVEATKATHEIRVRPNSMCSFSNEGSFFDSAYIYMQEYDASTGVLQGEKVYADNNIQVIKISGSQAYYRVRIDKKCNLYQLMGTGNYCIVFDEETVFSPHGKVIYSGNFTNCTCNYADGEEYTEDKRSIIITADAGYEFFGTEYHYITTDEYPDILPFINESYRLISETEEPYDAIWWNGEDVILDMEYTAEAKPEEIASFINLYNMTNEELSSFAHSRFHVTEDNTFTDMGQFISNLYVIPFIIPEDIKSKEKKPLVLGNFTSEIKSTLLLDYKMMIDMGSITITEKYGNVYDYLNTQCILHLPYFDVVYLNAEYVINQTIRIEYVIDFYTGSTTANIYSSFIDDIVQSVKSNIYVSIPFIQGYTNSVVGMLNGIYNHNKNYAYMEVTRNIPYNENTPFGKKTNDYGRIGDYTGFIKVGDINFISSATVDEAGEIIKILTGGVFINEQS